MTLVDSSGWIEYLNGTELGRAYLEHVSGPDLVVPTIVMYEVYKLTRQQRGTEAAELAMAEMKQALTVDLDEGLALRAAEVSLEHKLPMADAIIYATAQHLEARLITSDRHLEGLPDVVYLEKPAL